MSLKEMMAKRVARYADRRDDWTVFSLETELDPKYARSQRRYVGASGSVTHAEQNAVEPAAFTMSVQTMPAGHRIPAHCHETEETFFILEGECIVNVDVNIGTAAGDPNTVKQGSEGFDQSQTATTPVLPVPVGATTRFRKKPRSIRSASNRSSVACW